MALEIVKEIREAETEAENLRRLAVQRSKEVIRSAEDQAAKEIEAAADEARRMGEEIIKKKEDQGRQEAEKIMEDAAYECGRLKDVPADIADKAVNLVIERIVRSYGNS